MTSDNGRSGGDSDDGVNVAELRMDEVDDESSSSRKAEIRGRFEVGGRISSSSLSESMVMQSTDVSAVLEHEIKLEQISTLSLTKIKKVGVRRRKMETRCYGEVRLVGILIFYFITYIAEKASKVNLKQ